MIVQDVTTYTSLLVDNLLSLLHYVKGKKIQQDSPYSVWLATVGGWVENLVNPLQMSSGIKDAVGKMHTQGLPTDAPIYIGAHSLGGTLRSVC